jgi:uncharacterized cofD-like protein
MPSNLLKWLYPGMRIKRWLAVAAIGVLIVGFGALAVGYSYWQVRVLGIVVLICGVSLIVIGIGKLIVSFITLFLPEGERELVNILYEKRFLERGPRIVTVGGGHGLSNLLLGLKDYSANLTAIVTVADSGGSSGRLREEFNIVAPGDIRNCLVALADAPKLMGELFQYRFKTASQLQGHNFGNLFLTAMVQVTGDFEKAVKESSRVLAIRGQVVPATVSNVQLVAEYEDGSVTEGEAKIPNPGLRIKTVFLKPENAVPTQDALTAIEQADVIILGPGSLYTSVIPNLLIKSISDAISQSRAYKIYVCNVMTQPGETDKYSASEHIEAIVKHSNPNIINACLMNSAEVSSAEALARYELEGSFPVLGDIEKVEAMGFTAVAKDLISVNDYVRHDSGKLTKELITLIEKNRVIKR